MIRLLIERVEFCSEMWQLTQSDTVQLLAVWRIVFYLNYSPVLKWLPSLCFGADWNWISICSPGFSTTLCCAFTVHCNVVYVTTWSTVDYTSLFHELLSAPMFHHSVWSVITAHNLTPAKHDVITVVSDQRSRFNRVSTIHDYNTPDTVVIHRRPK